MKIHPLQKVTLSRSSQSTPSSSTPSSSTPSSSSSKWQWVSGVVVRGHGVASGVNPESPYPRGTIAMQESHFRMRGLNLDGIYPATLNVSIWPHTFKVVSPRMTFRKVRWTGQHPAEHFSFSPCRLLALGERVEGWVYYPHPETKQLHKKDEQTLEVLAPYIEGITYGTPVTLVVHEDEIRIEDA